MMSFSTSLILASGSSARRMLLENAGLTVQARPVDLDEEALRRSCEAQGQTLSETAIALADAKANLATRDLGFEDLTVAADQILDLDGVAFAKPDSVAEAGSICAGCGGGRMFCALRSFSIKGARKSGSIWRRRV